MSKQHPDPPQNSEPQHHTAVMAYDEIMEFMKSVVTNFDEDRAQEIIAAAFHEYEHGKPSEDETQDAEPLSNNTIRSAYVDWREHWRKRWGFSDE